jgi:AraC-like DNA-binding protein
VRNARLIAVQAWIDRHLARPDLAPETIAAANHISVRYLYRLFESEGTTVGRWIKVRRLEGCRRELTDPSLARYGVGAIGVRWGLLDPASFSRAFRSAYGMSPREYRAQAVGAVSLIFNPPGG